MPRRGSSRYRRRARFVVKHRLIPLEHCAMATAYEIPYPNYIRLGVSGRCIDVSAQNQHEYEH
jgi:hypothetical protein